MNERQRKEDLRRAAVKFLCERSVLAFLPDAVARLTFRRGLVDFEPSADDAQEALEYLAGLGIAREIPNRLGDTPAYKITEAGIVAHGRGEV